MSVAEKNLVSTVLCIHMVCKFLHSIFSSCRIHLAISTPPHDFILFIPSSGPSTQLTGPWLINQWLDLSQLCLKIEKVNHILSESTGNGERLFSILDFCGFLHIISELSQLSPYVEAAIL